MVARQFTETRGAGQLRGRLGGVGVRSVRTKILGLVGLLIVALIVLGLVAATSMTRLRDRTASMASTQDTVSAAFMELNDSVWTYKLTVDVLGDYFDLGLDTTDQYAAIESARQDIDERVAAFEDAYTVISPSPPAEYAAFVVALGDYTDAVEQDKFPAFESDDWDTYEAANLVVTERGDAAETEASTATTVIVAVIAIGSLVGAALGWVVSGRIRRNVVRVQTAIESMAGGDLTRNPDVTGADELGEMARALSSTQASLRRTLSGVLEASDTLASGAEELSMAARQIVTATQQTSDRSGVVASAAEQVSQSVHTVATGAEQLGASIREIAESSTEAAKVASSAAHEAAATNDTVHQLGEASQQIGAVIKTITSIAEQTNLLALNATIEAARAGSAGKGFAVVAGEVKELAQQTATATTDIARRIEAIQQTTDDAVAAIEQITATVSTINDYQLTIASAVEEQTATTAEISRGVAEAATGSTEIAGSIAGIAGNAQDNATTLEHMSEAVVDLAKVAETLRSHVAQFRIDTRD